MKLEELKKDFEKIAAKLSRALSNPKASLSDYAVGLVFARSVEKTFDPKAEGSISNVAKAKLVEAIKEQGKRIDGKASTYLMSSGWKLSMYPTRVGTDPKKLQARLIAYAAFWPGEAADKERLVKKYMKMVPTYEVDDLLLAKAMKDKVLTAEDVKSCEYDESWTVPTPKLDED